MDKPIGPASLPRVAPVTTHSLMACVVFQEDKEEVMAGVRVKQMGLGDLSQSTLGWVGHCGEICTSSCELSFPCSGQDGVGLE